MTDDELLVVLGLVEDEVPVYAIPRELEVPRQEVRGLQQSMGWPCRWWTNDADLSRGTGLARTPTETRSGCLPGRENPRAKIDVYP